MIIIGIAGGTGSGKTTVVNNGWITAHAGPNMVCLYFEINSLFTKRIIMTIISV